VRVKDGRAPIDEVEVHPAGEGDGAAVAVEEVEGGELVEPALPLRLVHSKFKLERAQCADPRLG
jgi:hypothetical protein